MDRSCDSVFPGYMQEVPHPYTASLKETHPSFVVLHLFVFSLCLFIVILCIFTVIGFVPVVVVHLIVDLKSFAFLHCYFMSL